GGRARVGPGGDEDAQPEGGGRRVEQERSGGRIVIGRWALWPPMPGATTAGTDRQRVAATVVQWSAARNTTATITAARAETVQAFGVPSRRTGSRTRPARACPTRMSPPRPPRS